MPALCFAALSSSSELVSNATARCTDQLNLGAELSLRAGHVAPLGRKSVPERRARALALNGTPAP
jgi:hypothetical protein